MFPALQGGFITAGPPGKLTLFFFLILIYLSASGLGCGMQGLSLRHTDSPVVGNWLACSEAREILVPQGGIEPTSLALQGRFVTTEP